MEGGSEKSPGRTKSYAEELGGKELEILLETTVKLKRVGYSHTAIVLLQKNFLDDLLFEMDVLSELGVKFVQKTASSKEAVDLLSHKKCITEEAKEKIRNFLGRKRYKYYYF